MSDSEQPKKRRYRKKEKEVPKEERERIQVEELKTLLSEGVFENFEQYSSLYVEHAQGSPPDPAT